MAININSASVKELTTLPGIGVKFAQIIVSKREELGTISIDTIHDNPSLQTKLNELAEKGLIILKYIEKPLTDPKADPTAQQADIIQLSHVVGLIPNRLKLWLKRWKQTPQK